MFLLVLTLCYIGYFCWHRYRVAFKDAPKIVPFWECMKILTQDTDLWHKAKWVCKLAQERGGVMCGWFYMRGVRGIYVITDPEDSMTVLKTCAAKDTIYQIWKPWLGVTAFIGNAQGNRFYSKFFAKVLTPSNMEAFMSYFNEHSTRLVLKLSDQVGRGPVDMVRPLRMFNLELLCDTMLALDDFKNTNLEEYLDAASSFLKIAMHRFHSIYLQYDFICNWTELKKKQDHALKVLHHTSDQIILQRRLKLKQIQENISEPPTHCMLIDVFIEAVENGLITEQALRSEIDGLIFAGHDTSAYTLLYILVLMGSYPHVQERAFEEAQNILGDRKIVMKSDLAKMVYIEAIIKESMRLYPYVAIQPRSVEGDIKLKSCTMRAGCTAAVFSWGVHRHESWGADVEQFRPERWLQPDRLPRPAVLLGFSEGARVCMGRRYAMMSMKTLIVHLIRNFTFKADHTAMKFKYVGVLEPHSGHHIAIEKRSQTIHK